MSTITTGTTHGFTVGDKFEFVLPLPSSHDLYVRIVKAANAYLAEPAGPRQELLYRIAAHTYRQPLTELEQGIEKSFYIQSVISGTTISVGDSPPSARSLLFWLKTLFMRRVK